MKVKELKKRKLILARGVRPTKDGRYILIKLKRYDSRTDFEDVEIEQMEEGVVVQDGYNDYEYQETITTRDDNKDWKKIRLPKTHTIKLKKDDGEIVEFYHNCRVIVLDNHNEERAEDIHRLNKLINEYQYNQVIFSDNIVERIEGLIKKLYS